ncbi:MAG: YbjQ family protein [Rhodospirillales bacterium]|nr:YbjQ family protein [Rhodospirillales bacterium]
MPDFEYSYQIGWFLLLLLTGYLAGRYNERRHYRSIRKRELGLKDLLVFSTRHLPADGAYTAPAMVLGSAVISVDYFKSFLASLRRLIGGNIDSYESLVERARREAILRMKLEARNQGADMVFNVKLETSRVYSGEKNLTQSVEVLAYGTAVKRLEQSAEIH